MSTPAQVESIFFAALGKSEAAERAGYLDRACGADSELRRRVERLLEAHPQAANFLARPAVERPEVPPDGPADNRLGFAPSAAPKRVGGAALGGHELAETVADGLLGEADNALAVSQPSAKPGSLGRLVHFEVLEVLGKGTVGTVVKAFDEERQRLVAIKLMSPLLAATSSPRKRFLREGRSASAVRHPNIIAIHAVESRPIPYLVMDYIAGPSLQQKLDATGPLALAEILHIGRQIADGLAAAHSRGLLHRDIKPSNVLLDASGTARVADFGLARAADDAGNARSRRIAETPIYMAPEQAKGETIDQRADLFSLGGVLYAMCTGRPPSRAANSPAGLDLVTEDMPRPIREIAPEVPEWLCDLIGRLHARKPSGRFASARGVSDLLARRLAELRHPGSVPAPPDVPMVAAAKMPPPRETSATEEAR
jgi:eukaryotic-like serine/threonine-protein kinase